MEYFHITNWDVSKYVSGLKITKNANYSAKTNAAGNTVVDYINTKRTFEVSFILMDDTNMLALQSRLNRFNFDIKFRNPDTKEIETVNVIMPNNDIEYYTIQTNNIRYKAFTLTFIEL